MILAAAKMKTLMELWRHQHTSPRMSMYLCLYTGVKMIGWQHLL